MEEDKEDDPNLIISFPRRDRDRAGHGAGRRGGLSERFTRGMGLGLSWSEVRPTVQRSNGCLVCSPQLSSCFLKTRYRN